MSAAAVRASVKAVKIGCLACGLAHPMVICLPEFGPEAAAAALGDPPLEEPHAATTKDAQAATTTGAVNRNSLIRTVPRDSIETRVVGTRA
jgi:hypothetical protein